MCTNSRSLPLLKKKVKSCLGIPLCLLLLGEPPCGVILLEAKACFHDHNVFKLVHSGRYYSHIFTWCIFLQKTQKEKGH